MSWSLLDLGPFDEGGLQNNLRLKFKIWFMDALDLLSDKGHQGRVVTDHAIRLYIFSRRQDQAAGDLQVELEVQAYPDDYMATFETVLGGAVDPPTPTPPLPPPYVLEFARLTYSGVLYLTSTVSGS
jgi:hypothetical protein